uniref:Uncharacterized protein n=1 Tax=Lotus japonicus TaxID=34305 RepID=I3SH45_LOTJA|nr:unknown [Lotus japonicus]
MRAPLAQPSGFSFRLKKGENVPFPHWTFHVPHDVTILVIQKLNSDLSDLTSGSSTTHNFDNNSMLHLRLHPVASREDDGVRVAAASSRFFKRKRMR